MIASRRLGILGGTFDPIHFGHLDAADAARRALQLDRVLLIPSFDPPHRPADPMASVPSVRLVRASYSWPRRTLGPDMELTRTDRRTRLIRFAPWRVRDGGCLADFLHSRQRRIRRNRHVARVSGRARHANFVVIARPGTTLDAAAERTSALRTPAHTRQETSGASRPFSRRGAHARRVIEHHPRPPDCAATDRRPRSRRGRATHRRASFVRSGRRLAWPRHSDLEVARRRHRTALHARGPQANAPRPNYPRQWPPRFASHATRRPGT